MRGHRLPEDVSTHVQSRVGRAGQQSHTSANWPRLAEAGRGVEAALSWTWRWRGLLEGDLAEASRRHSPHIGVHGPRARRGGERAPRAYGLLQPDPHQDLHARGGEQLDVQRCMVKSRVSSCRNTAVLHSRRLACRDSPRPPPRARGGPVSRIISESGLDRRSVLRHMIAFIALHTLHDAHTHTKAHRHHTHLVSKVVLVAATRRATVGERSYWGGEAAPR